MMVSKFMELPYEEQQTIFDMVEEGDIGHASECPMDGCKGTLSKDVAFFKTKNSDEYLIEGTVLTCNRKRCGLALIIEWNEEEAT